MYRLDSADKRGVGQLMCFEAKSGRYWTREGRVMRSKPELQYKVISRRKPFLGEALCLWTLNYDFGFCLRRPRQSNLKRGIEANKVYALDKNDVLNVRSILKQKNNLETLWERCGGGYFKFKECEDK